LYWKTSPDCRAKNARNDENMRVGTSVIPPLCRTLKIIASTE
jgi:hypothetical protein